MTIELKNSEDDDREHDRRERGSRRGGARAAAPSRSSRASPARPGAARHDAASGRRRPAAASRAADRARGSAPRGSRPRSAAPRRACRARRTRRPARRRVAGDGAAPVDRVAARPPSSARDAPAAPSTSRSRLARSTRSVWERGVASRNRTRAAAPPASSCGDAQRDDPAAVEDRDAVGHLLDVGQVVARQEHRDAVVAECRAAAPGSPPGASTSMPGRRLVEDRDQLRPPDERQREPQPLPLPARQPPVARPAGRLRQSHERQQLVGRRGASDGTRPWSRSDLAGGHPRVDPAAALEHQPDPRPVVPRRRRRVVAEHPDRALVGAPVALEDLDRRRLAGAVRPEQGERSRRARPGTRVPSTTARPP